MIKLMVSFQSGRSLITGDAFCRLDHVSGEVIIATLFTQSSSISLLANFQVAKNHALNGARILHHFSTNHLRWSCETCHCNPVLL